MEVDSKGSMVAVCSIKSSFDILGVTKLVFWDEDVVQLVGVSFHRWCSWGGEPCCIGTIHCISVLGYGNDVAFLPAHLLLAQFVRSSRGRAWREYMWSAVMVLVMYIGMR